VPAVTLAAVSIERTDKMLDPAGRVTSADHVPAPAVASIQVVPSRLTWIFSPAPRAPVNVPLTLCAATLVMKSPAAPESALRAVTVATACGRSASRVKACPVPAVTLAARSIVRTDRVPLPDGRVTPAADQVPAPAIASIQVAPSTLTWI